MTVSGTTSGSLSGASSSLFGYGVIRSGNVFSVAATSATELLPSARLSR
jgi:hypothetical protein